MKFFLLILFFTFSVIDIYANELKKSTSPYLLQHKDNPVDWMEWSDRAFKKAKKENKFIFLSIGYSTCHWCHVMARESFGKKDVAKILNRDFVSIKVDKERLSYIDNYYQLGYRLINNRAGGWPLTVILLPNRKPVYFGTYMPKDRLIELLKQLTVANRKKLESIADSIDRVIKEAQNGTKTKVVKIGDNLLKKAFQNLKSSYDFKNKGFSIAPKFPQATALNLLLNEYLIDDNKEALKMATDTLDAMAKGGIYDQIDGAFFRYSVDKRWEIPHFEKMLYTNAELISVYAKAYKITKKRLYARIVDESIKEIDRRFLKNGLYYSASNADSKDEDGKEREGYFFIYNYDKALDYLVKNGITKTRAKEALKYFGIELDGNFEGGDFSNPKIAKPNPKFDREKQLLSNYRDSKEYPFIDKKINTAWNALYIKAKMDAGAVNKRFTKEALVSLHILLKLMHKNGRLYHQTLLPYKPIQEGLLEDYAFVLDLLFSAYQNTLDDSYLKTFKELTNRSIKLFFKDGRWYESTDSKFKVEAKLNGSSYKSALATNLQNILKYVAVSGDYGVLNIANDTIKRNSLFLTTYPHYYLEAIDTLLMRDRGVYFVKGAKDELLKLNIKNEVKYPFVYIKAEKIKEYLLCGLNSCFSSSNSLDKIRLELKKRIDN